MRYLMIAVIFRDRAAQEHKKLLECALRRDAKDARATLATHITDCVTYTLSHDPSGLLGPRQPELSKLRKSADQAAVPV
jgi:DNA-binding GntR family transcriptional regulator